MPKFKPGDKVKEAGSFVYEIDYWDAEKRGYMLKPPITDAVTEKPLLVREHQLRRA